MATSESQLDAALVWFRRDLRDFDHAALHHALKSARRVFCAFVFDRDILDALEDKADRRVEFIWESARELQATLQSSGGDLIVLHGSAKTAIPQLAKSLAVEAVFANRDYEPEAVARDAAVANALQQCGIAFHAFKDQAIFERDEILTLAGKPYGVFTPYKNSWLKKVDASHVQAYPIKEIRARLAKPGQPGHLPTLEALGFRRTNLSQLKLPVGMSGGEALLTDFLERIDHYRDRRDFPALKGPSYLSVHLRFGTVSIRSLAGAALARGGYGADTWLSELIWRDFYFQILHHHPRVAAGHAFKPEFDKLAFPGDTALFDAWANGQTGYPLVDAAMRQLNTTGYMHNRLRMVAASFLVKDLLVDWRRGERYFAQKLIDYDLSANNGGWQWAASTGCDAQPWFRIFNPVTQSEKFDPQGKFIRKYVPELQACNDGEIHAPWKISAARLQQLDILPGRDYPMPVVDHDRQRKLALQLYSAAKH